MTHQVDLTIDGQAYRCQTGDVFPVWRFPIGTAAHPPERWYCAQFHKLSTPPQAGDHTGWDLNLDQSPWGDVDFGMPVYALADGEVYYTTDSWSGAGMAVVEHQWGSRHLWARYAHIDLLVASGMTVLAGETIGTIGAWRTGDHLHLDMAFSPFTVEWLDGSKLWTDPGPVLKRYLDPDKVDAMLRKGA